MASPTGTPLPAAIGHVVARQAPRVASRATAVLRMLLAPRLASPEPSAWTGSRLTGDGFPFEAAFCSADPRLRFTIEPGAAGLDPQQRLGLAGALVDAAGGGQVPPLVLRELRELQAGAVLRYGAWIGCRIGADDLVLKLYVEFPADDRTHRLADLARVQEGLGARTVVPRMIGYTPADGAFECYLRVPSLMPHDLPGLLAPAGAQAQAAWLLDWIEQAYGHPVRDRLPGPSVGLSYVLAPAPRVTLHFYARALWGSDARIRHGLARLARSIGWDPQDYLAATAPLEQRSGWRTFHGLVGITLAGTAPAVLTVGVRPLAP